MLAKELAEILLQEPEAHVVVTEEYHQVDPEVLFLGRDRIVIECTHKGDGCLRYRPNLPNSIKGTCPGYNLGACWYCGEKRRD